MRRGSTAVARQPAGATSAVAATVLRFPDTARAKLPAYGSAAVGIGQPRSRALLALSVSAVFHIVVLAAIAAVTRESVPASTVAAPAPNIMHVELASAPPPSTASLPEQAAFRPGEGVQRRAATARRMPFATRAKARAVPGVAPEPVALVATETGSVESQRPAESTAVAGAPVQNPASPTAREEIAAARSAPASYSHAPKPEYPWAAREDGQEGVVVLRVHVSRRGSPTEVQVDRSSGFALLDRAAISAVGHWAFTPAMADGRQIESWMEIPIRFRLGDP